MLKGQRPAWTVVVLCCLLNSAWLQAAPAPAIGLTNLALLPQGGLVLQSFGAPGSVYSLQASWGRQNWRTLDFTISHSGDATFQDRSAPGEQVRYYRVKAEPPNVVGWDTNYHGWSNSFTLSNGQVEVAVVPAVGRIMQFRFSDEADGPLWENTSLAGNGPTASSWDNPGSFGGDKVWPAPQSVWNWPPPRGFDSLPFTAAVQPGGITLTGPVDAAFGIRVVREIALHPSEPLLRVTSRFEKVTGNTNQVGVWVITQVKEAECVFVPVPSASIFAKGYTPLGAVPKGLVFTNGLISFARDPGADTKIGNDAGALLWVGTKTALLIESARVPGVSKTGYPDGGCSAEVYTHANPVPYIELELLAPLVSLGTNTTTEATSVYTLLRRTKPSALEEAKIILSR
jgi:hypothetical protein